MFLAYVVSCSVVTMTIKRNQSDGNHEFYSKPITFVGTSFITNAESSELSIGICVTKH